MSRLAQEVFDYFDWFSKPGKPPEEMHGVIKRGHDYETAERYATIDVVSKEFMGLYSGRPARETNEGMNMGKLVIFDVEPDEFHVFEIFPDTLPKKKPGRSREG